MNDTDIIKTCWNCGNNGGDKTDHTDNNPCTNCAVQWSMGFANLVSDGSRINWEPQ